MKNSKWMFLLVISFLLGQCSDKKKVDQPDSETTRLRLLAEEPIVIIEIKKIINKSLPEVVAIWGQPEKVESVTGYPCKTSNCKRVVFDKGKYEVIFKNGRADRITIKKRGAYLEMNDRLIQSLGLSKATPSFSNPSTVIKWNDVEGIKEVSFFNNGYDKVDYILIAVTDSE